jgi:hypothetical protein
MELIIKSPGAYDGNPYFSQLINEFRFQFQRFFMAFGEYYFKFIFILYLQPFE